MSWPVEDLGAGERLSGKARCLIDLAQPRVGLGQHVARLAGVRVLHANRAQGYVERSFEKLPGSGELAR